MPFDELLYKVTFACVICCWIAFAAAFLLAGWRRPSVEKKRDDRARVGILTAVLGYAVVWFFRREEPLLIQTGGPVLGTALSVAAILVACFSVWLASSAVRRLGKQWAVSARVVEGHELVTDGAYGIVRNPIYSGMFGMLIATGISLSRWWAVPLGMLVYWYGTHIRIQAEEQLLRETFGEEFDAYARRVPALIPGVF